ncbi:MAG: HDOD domain-containing protein [Solirubrobacterales bacterium]
MSQAAITRGSRRRQRQSGAGGRRLAAAFDLVSSLPALAEARRRLLGACDHRPPSANDLADLVESDAGLAIAVMRAANNGAGPPGGAAGVRDAVEGLRAEGVRALVDGLDTYDLFDRPGLQAERHERFRRHAVAVRAAAERIAELARLPERDQLAVAALLHDVGRPVLAELHGDEYLDDRDHSPDDRVRRERRELGIDHALVGAVLLRRWSLPDPIAAAVERHHTVDATGHAAAIRLADLVVHHAGGDTVPADSMRTPAAALGIDDRALCALIFDFPHAGGQRRRASEPCPLSVRELDALRGLAEGKVYKQIAHELTLSVSTVRTHLHNVYRKIGAVDRAQAVLIARDRGWL